MTVKAAIDRLGTWTVAGVKTPYALASQPSQVPYTSLPALVILPVVSGSDKAFDLALTSSGVLLRLHHALLVSGISGSYYGARVYSSLDLIDAYFAKVETDWTLNALLAEPLQITNVEYTPVNYGGSAYQAVVFHHQWSLLL